MADSNKASKTALMAAIHRFLAYKEKDFQGPDDMTKIFLPRKVRFLLSFKYPDWARSRISLFRKKRGQKLAI